MEYLYFSATRFGPP